LGESRLFFLWKKNPGKNAETQRDWFEFLEPSLWRRKNLLLIIGPKGRLMSTQVFLGVTKRNKRKRIGFFFWFCFCEFRGIGFEANNLLKIVQSSQKQFLNSSFKIVQPIFVLV